MRASFFKRLLLKLSLSTVFVCCAAAAFAAAWTQAQEKGIVILSSSYYRSRDYYDDLGLHHAQDAYSKQEQNIYAEYGIRDWLTLGGSASFTSAQQASFSSYGIDDSTVFLRARLWQGDGFVFSAAPILKLPSPSSRTQNPVIGSGHASSGLQLSGGYGFEAFGQHHFAALDASYLYRFGEPKDQLRLDATLGIGLTDKWMFMPQMFITRRMGSGNTGFTQSSGDDYNLATLRLSAVYALTEETSLQLGAYDDISAKNAGAGKGLVVSVWRKF